MWIVDPIPRCQDRNTFMDAAPVHLYRYSGLVSLLPTPTSTVQSKMVYVLACTVVCLRTNSALGAFPPPRDLASWQRWIV